ncbi:hypothetical protein EDD93_7490 [Streptomyces sp. 840.1]|uniref:hypothetical protein n=1 Tax=Streptomyces sp. 840.1 TaxID=2485152 RepID=UPI000FA706BB|nr:hypothetical protein [Streptomyces sp. 840.1]ROQ60071.1 hypothetical protein EDD93_7490 [Streptomyces sp. 840.1]
MTATVSDPNPAHPRERTPGLNGANCGFRRHVIRHLTNHLTITPGPGPGPGKTIHAQLPR